MTYQTALPELLTPFARFWNPKTCVVKCKSVGFEQWEVDAHFFAEDGTPVEIPESKEIQKIVDLWGEPCFFDLIHNVFVNHIFQNMVAAGVSEVIARI